MWEVDVAALIPSGPPSNQGGEAYGLHFTAEETHAGRLKCPPEVLRQVQLGFAPTPASLEASVLSALQKLVACHKSCSCFIKSKRNSSLLL